MGIEDRLAKFKEGIKAGDLVTVTSSHKYFPVCRNNGKWFIVENPKSHLVKKGEALIVVVDKPVAVSVECPELAVAVGDDGEDTSLTEHEVIVFASASACFFGLPRSSLGRY